MNDEIEAMLSRIKQQNVESEHRLTESEARTARLEQGLGALKDCSAAFENQMKTMNSAIEQQEQRGVSMQSGIDRILALMSAKGADDWDSGLSWGKDEPAKPL